MKRFKVLLIICTLFFGNVFGQSVNEYRKAHRELLARQTRIMDRIGWQEHLYKIKVNENEFLTTYWDNDKLNPYENASLEHINIDMRDYVNPVKSSVITSHFGYRATFGRNHYGVDLQASISDTIYASFDGKIRLVKFERSGYGFYIVIRHMNGVETLYAHLSKFLVKPNQIVKAGDPIALSGNSGRSTGPHLHYEIRYMGISLNPEKLVDFTTHIPRSAFITYSDDLRHGLRSKNTYARNTVKNRHIVKTKSTNKKRRKRS